MKKIILSVYVPCFNEEHHILGTLKNIIKGIKNLNYEILVANDASTDKSLELVKKFKKLNPNANIRIFSNKVNKGLGYNFWKIAKKAKGKYYAIIFGDNAVSSRIIKNFISKIGKAEIVLTYQKKDKRDFFRKNLSKLFVKIINLITSNNLTYYNGNGLYLLKDIKAFKSNPSGFAFQAELITHLLMQNKTYIELGIIPFYDKNKKFSKSEALKLKNIFSIIKSIIHIFLSQIIHLLKH